MAGRNAFARKTEAAFIGRSVVGLSGDTEMTRESRIHIALMNGCKRRVCVCRAQQRASAAPTDAARLDCARIFPFEEGDGETSERL
jgi:hypothetical protein